MKNNFKQAFTLVELIVVITILAVLATVAFISFQGYSTDSRDTKRITDIKTIYSALNYYKLSSLEKYPTPGNKVDITMSGSSNIIFYQWLADKNVQQNINVFWDVKDPSTWDYYAYTTNVEWSKFSVLTKLESWVSGLHNFNVSANQWIIKWFGSWVGALVDSNNNFVTTGVDLASVTDGQYWVAFEKDTLKNIDKNDLISLSVSNNKNLSHLDTDLWVYYDMETSINWQLKDFGKYWLHLTATWWIKIGWENGLSWGATYFDGKDDFFYTLDSSVFEPQNFTINVLTKPKLSWEHDYLFQKWCPSSQCNYSWFAMTTRFTDKLRTFFMYKDSLNETKMQHIISNFDINTNYQLFTSTYDWNNIKTYINWELKEQISASWTTIYHEDNLMLIWKNYINTNISNSWNFHGIIDEVKIYEKALNWEEIKAIYNNFILD